MRFLESFSNHEDFYIISDSLMDFFDEHGIDEWSSPSQPWPNGIHWRYKYNIGRKVAVMIDKIPVKDYKSLSDTIQSKLRQSIEGRLGKSIIIWGDKSHTGSESMARIEIYPDRADFLDDHGKFANPKINLFLHGN